MENELKRGYPEDAEYDYAWPVDYPSEAYPLYPTPEGTLFTPVVRVAQETRFVEREHPRDRHGRFAETPGGNGLPSSPVAGLSDSERDGLERYVRPDEYAAMQEVFRRGAPEEGGRAKALAEAIQRLGRPRTGERLYRMTSLEHAPADLRERLERGEPVELAERGFFSAAN